MKLKCFYICSSFSTLSEKGGRCAYTNIYIHKYIYIYIYIYSFFFNVYIYIDIHIKKICLLSYVACKQFEWFEWNAILTGPTGIGVWSSPRSSRACWVRGRILLYLTRAEFLRLLWLEFEFIALQVAAASQKLSAAARGSDTVTVLCMYMGKWFLYREHCSGN